MVGFRHTVGEEARNKEKHHRSHSESAMGLEVITFSKEPIRKVLGLYRAPKISSPEPEG